MEFLEYYQSGIPYNKMHSLDEIHIFPKFPSSKSENNLFYIVYINDYSFHSYEAIHNPFFQIQG